MNFLSESFTARIKEQVKDQLPQILPQEVSNFAPPVIEKLFHETRDEVTLAKASSQPQSTYEAASTLTEFELKKILLDKIEKNFFYSYDVYTLKRGRKDKDKDEDPSAGSDRGLKRRNTSKDAEPTTDPKKKDSTSGSSKGTKSQSRSSGKSVQSEESVFEVADSDMPQDQEGDMGDNEDEPRKETASRSEWFKKPTLVQEPTNPDWYIGKTTQERPPQKWLMTLAASTSTDKSLNDFDELMSTPIDFSSFIMNEGYKALLEKLDWENPEGGGILTMTYTMSTTKTKSTQYDLPGIEDMVPNIWSPVKRILAVTHVLVMRKYGYGYLEEIVVRRSDNILYRFKEGDDVADFAIALRMHLYTPYKDPQGFIYVDDFGRNRLMRSDKLYKFIDGTLTRLLSSLEDITKNIDMTYLPKRRWSTLEKKRAHFMIKDINKLLKERRMMRSLEKFVCGRLYGTDLRLLQRTI
ncbi:hypothetical protein Tco_0680210 [Tanacetum coccineum]|uniref:Uncharacterized protein n=1 Tax=Tanacetum coccineum TaxID=301880 RepID=A0ABQ4XKU4_9ASTR